MFENRTKFDIDLRLEVASGSTKLFSGIFYTLGTIITVVGALLMALTSYGIDIIIDGIIIVLAGYLIGAIVKLLISVQHKKSFYKDNTTFTFYKFSEDNMTQKVMIDEKFFSEIILKYSDIKLAKETDKYILLFISSSNCFAIDKNGMIDGSSAELSEFLRTKIKRYKVKIR